jgi:hypothetical protein
MIVPIIGLSLQLIGVVIVGIHLFTYKPTPIDPKPDTLKPPQITPIPPIPPAEGIQTLTITNPNFEEHPTSKIFYQLNDGESHITSKETVIFTHLETPFTIKAHIELLNQQSPIIQYQYEAPTAPEPKPESPLIDPKGGLFNEPIQITVQKSLANRNIDDIEINVKALEPISSFGDIRSKAPVIQFTLAESVTLQFYTKNLKTSEESDRKILAYEIREGPPPPPLPTDKFGFSKTMPIWVGPLKDKPFFKTQQSLLVYTYKKASERILSGTITTNEQLDNFLEQDTEALLP